MNRITAAWILAIVAISTDAPRAQGQSALLNQELLKDWLQMKDLILKLAAEMPEEKYSFKTTAAQRDFGQQALHIATGNLYNLSFLKPKASPPTINRQAKSKTEIMKALADSFDYGTAVIKEQTDQSIMEVVQTNQYLGPSSRARVLYFLLGHGWDIYGQMVVYLRLNGGVPPASQRP